MARSSCLNRGARLVAICALVLLATPALADSLAAIPPAGAERARADFSDFVTTWMAKLKVAEAQQRKSPGTSAQRVTYRSIGEDISTELQPTGHPAAPYIGILRYREQTHSCSNAETASCTVASAMPVTEIFRYQGGRWVY